MTVALYLSRVCLAKDASIKALLPLLLGGADETGRPEHTGHHLIWSLFAAGREGTRDFLWRAIEPQGTFLVLSARPPANPHRLFNIDEPKEFSPTLASGDRLHFSLRANPVVRRRHKSRPRRSVKHDIVMDALRAYPLDQRADKRFEVAQTHGIAWLKMQASNSGFAVCETDVRVDGYRQHRIRRRGVRGTMEFSSLDFDGVLKVRDPQLFVSAIARGFGAAKGFGCGLMLIRRPYD